MIVPPYFNSRPTSLFFFVLFLSPPLFFFFFFFNDTATTEIYTLSLHDALPISQTTISAPTPATIRAPWDMLFHCFAIQSYFLPDGGRSEEHTSELQSHSDLVCRLLLEKKKKQNTHAAPSHLHHNSTCV